MKRKVKVRLAGEKPKKVEAPVFIEKEELAMRLGVSFQAVEKMIALEELFTKEYDADTWIDGSLGNLSHEQTPLVFLKVKTGVELCPEIFDIALVEEKEDPLDQRILRSLTSTKWYSMKDVISWAPVVCYIFQSKTLEKQKIDVRVY